MTGRGMVIPERDRSEGCLVTDDDRFVVVRRRSRVTQEVASVRAIGIALYSRYSSPGRDTDSEIRQFQGAEVQASSMSEPVVRRYSDRGVSGATLERTGIKALMRGAEDREFGIVVIESVSRLGRDLGHLLFVFDRLERLGVELWTSKGVRVDRNRLYVEGLLAQLDRLEIASITRRGRHVRFQDGVLSHLTAYGFMTRPRYPGHKFPHPRRAATVKEMYRRVVAGEKPSLIADSFTRLRRPCPSDCHRLDRGEPSEGRPWTSTMIHQIVRNPLNAGLLTDGKAMAIKDPDTLKVLAIEARDVSSWDMVTIVEMALVDGATWIAATDRLAKKRIVKAPSVHRSAILLGQATRCWACGAVVRLEYGGGGRAWYRCAGAEGCVGIGSPTRAAVESAVLEALRSLLGGEEQEGNRALRDAIRTIETDLPFIARSTSDHAAAALVRSSLDEVSIRPPSEIGVQLIDVSFSLAAKHSAASGDPKPAGSYAIQLRQAQDVSDLFEPRMIEPLTDDQRAKLLPNEAWPKLEVVAASSGLCLKRTGWSPRTLLEMMLLFCLSDRRPYDVPRNLGPYATFTKAARRAVRGGFWEGALALLRREHPLVVSGARLQRIDRFREDLDEDRWTAKHAEEAANQAVSPDVRARLQAVAEVMKGRRLDLLASRRLHIPEQILAAWVISFRDSGPDAMGKMGDDIDAKVLASAALLLKLRVAEAGDPKLRVKLTAIERYLGFAEREEIVREAGVAWLGVRKWITASMTAGLGDLAPNSRAGILTAGEVAELRDVVVGRIDPNNEGAPVSGIVLQRICRERFGRSLCVNSIMYNVAKGWSALETGEVDLSSGYRNRILRELRSIISTELGGSLKAATRASPSGEAP